MIRIQTHKVIPFLLFFIVITSLLFLPYFSQVELPVAQMSAFGLETERAQVDEPSRRGRDRPGQVRHSVISCNPFPYMGGDFTI